MIFVTFFFFCVILTMNSIHIYYDMKRRNSDNDSPTPPPTHIRIRTPIPIRTPIAIPIPTPTPIDEVNNRLPLNIRPINYKVHLRPYLKESDDRKFTFDGECYIEIQALQKTKQIQLHISHLHISLSEYYKKGATGTTVLPKATPNNLTDIVVYNLNEELQVNISYILHYEYVGTINEEVRGFYRSKYTTTNGTKYLGATQFEPTYARSVFPSFDEPEFKATFDLSLFYDSSFQSMGPTPADARFRSKYYTKIYYRTTPIMSTYLLTFTVSEFYVHYDGQLGVVARPEYSSQTEYSHDCGRRLLAAFDNYFYTNLSTILAKNIHLDAVPNSELGESLLLYDKKESSLKSKQRATNMVAYEVAHLWFGYLVTCKWWGYIWLNEGFAIYFQSFGTDLVDKSFRMSSQFVIDVVQTVMLQDATGDARPMTNENVRTKDDINHMYNQISYLKAAAFIRMTKEILGEHNFRIFLNEYLTNYAYKNTVPGDVFYKWESLWPFELEQFAQKYLESFTTQEGYPVVTFNRVSNNSVEVSQKRFLLKDFGTANRKLTYTVPITYATSFKTNFIYTAPKFFLENGTVTINVTSNVSWIIGNIKATGYYRVNYDNNSWNEIRLKLFSESRRDIHVLNRAQIVDDLLNLARAGEIDYRVVLNILLYLKNETHYLPWAAALKGIRYLMTRLGNESNIFGPFLREIIVKNYYSESFEPIAFYSTLRIYKTTLILDWSCKYIIPGCVRQAMSYFNEISTKHSVGVNVRTVVYCTVMRVGNETHFNILYNKYKSETVSSEKMLILDSLSCVKDRKLVFRFFQLIISNELHAADTTVALFNLCTKNNENVDFVFNLIDKNIEQIANATGGYDSVAAVVVDIAEYFTTEAQLQKLNDFIKNHTDKFGVLILKRAVSVVKWNLKWSKENLKEIKSILAEIAPMKS